MRITVDTNLLISATFWYGDSNKIIEKVEKKEIELVLSKEILDEFRDVLDYDEIKEKIKKKNLEMIWTVEKVRELSTIIEPSEKLKVVKDDPDDDKIIECAKSGKVDFIVSSDNHLLKLKSYENIKILPPSDFLKQLPK